MDLKESVRSQFGRAAGDYATCHIHAAGPDLSAMTAAASLTGAERVLDVGCGAGHTALAFAPGAARVEALDLTPDMLRETERLARERGLENLRTRLGDVESLPYESASFDVVTCRQCAHHFAHPEIAVAEIARVLAPGGLFLLLDSVAPEDAKQDTFLNTIELLRDPSHVRDHSVSQWLAILDRQGFEAQLVDTWALDIEFDSWVARQNTPALAVAQLRALLGDACDELRHAFELDTRTEPGFTLGAALFRGRLAGPERAT